MTISFRPSHIAWIKSHIRSLILFLCLFSIISPPAWGSDDFDSLLQKAETGDPASQYEIGRSYLHGRGTARDPAKALEWHLRAAEQGHLQAMTNLGWMHESGTGVKRDYGQAALWYQKAAQKGYARAQRPLGVLHEMGKGVEKDPARAAYWYREAARQGLPRAQVNLGNLYETGVGVEQGYEEAASWYRKAAAAGYPRGQTHLGMLYEKGLGVEKDPKQAASWYRKAADRGYARARALLDHMEETPGSIPPQEEVELVAQDAATATDPDETGHAPPAAPADTGIPVDNETVVEATPHYAEGEKALARKDGGDDKNAVERETAPSMKLTLADLMRTVGARNHQILAREAQWAAKNAEAKKAFAVFEPELVSGVQVEDTSQQNTIEEAASRRFENVFEERNTDYSVAVEGTAPTGARLNLGYNMRKLSNTLIQDLTDQNSEYQMYFGGNLVQPLLKNRGREATEANIRMTEKDADAAFQEYRQEMMRIAANAGAAYWDLFLAQERVLMRTESVRAAEQFLRDNEQRFQVGKMAEIEVLEARAGLDQRKSQRSGAEQELIAAMNTLRTVMAASAAEETGVVVAVDEPDSEGTPPDYETALSDAFRMRPEYLWGLEKMERAHILLAYAENQAWPQLDLKASYGLNGLDFSGDRAFDQMTEARHDAWVIGLELRLPLLGGRKGRSELEKASQEKRQAIHELKAVEIAIANTVDTAVRNIHIAAEQANHVATMADIQERLLKEEMIRLQAGKSSSRIVLEREEDFREARESRLESLVNRRKACLILQVAKGTILEDHGIEPDPPQAAELAARR